jgi:hypothetical protein
VRRPGWLQWRCDGIACMSGRPRNFAVFDLRSVPLKDSAAGVRDREEGEPGTGMAECSLLRQQTSLIG